MSASSPAPTAPSPPQSNNEALVLLLLSVICVVVEASSPSIEFPPSPQQQHRHQQSLPRRHARIFLPPSHAPCPVGKAGYHQLRVGGYQLYDQGRLAEAKACFAEALELYLTRVSRIRVDPKTIPRGREMDAAREKVRALMNGGSGGGGLQDSGGGGAFPLPTNVFDDGTDEDPEPSDDAYQQRQLPPSGRSALSSPLSSSTRLVQPKVIKRWWHSDTEKTRIRRDYESQLVQQRQYFTQQQ